MCLPKILEQIRYYINHFNKYYMCKTNNYDYEGLEGDETVEYTFVRSHHMQR